MTDDADRASSGRSEGWTPSTHVIVGEPHWSWVDSVLVTRRPVDVLWGSTAWGLFVAILVAGLMSFDWVATSDLPLERAVVTENALTGNDITCGRALIPNADEKISRLFIENPAAGQTATAEHVGCEYAAAVGAKVPIKRDGTGDDAIVYIFPLTSAWDFLLVAGPAGAGTAACFVLLLGLRYLWSRRRGGAN